MRRFQMFSESYNQHPKSRQRKSRTLCPYCHNTHTQDELQPEGICPQMKYAAAQLQGKSAFECSECFGEGCFQRQVENKILESASRYEQRWKQWMQKAQERNPDEKPPGRRILKCQFVSTEEVCKQCRGQGKIKRMISNTEKYEDKQLIVNSTWLKYRMQPTKAKQEFYCSICLTDGKSSEQNFQLGCKHQFHFTCIISWLRMNEKCPICRHIDPFIDVSYAPQLPLEQQLDLSFDPQQLPQRGNRNISTDRMTWWQYEEENARRGYPFQSEYYDIANTQIIRVNVNTPMLNNREREERPREEANALWGRERPRRGHPERLLESQYRAINHNIMSQASEVDIEGSIT